MYIIYKKIKKDYKDKNILVSINGNSTLNNNRFEFDEFINTSIEKNVNEVIDSDSTIYNSIDNININFYLYNTNLNSFINDINDSNINKFQKSTFFMFNFYSDVKCKNFLFKNTIKLKSSLSINYNQNDKWYLNIPNNINYNTMYIVPYFYNGNNGNLYQFCLNSSGNINDNSELIIPVFLNEKTFNIPNTYNVYEILNENYNNRVQKNIDTIQNKSNIVPDGNKFYIDDNKITFNNG